MADPSRKRASPPGPTGSRSNKRARLEVLPDNPLRFHREPQGTVQISTWNVAGLASSNAEKWQFGLRKYIEAEDAHVVCFTEVNQKDAARFFEREPSWQFLRDRYPFRYWGDRTATVSKFRPVSPPIFGFPDGKHYDPEDGRARAVTLEFEELYLLATYVPNSGDKFKDLDRRKAWIADFDPFIRSLDAKKPVIWTGDFNVIRTVTPTSNETNDLAWPQNMGKLPGTHQVERDAHERLVGDPGWLENPRRRGKGFVDVWRLIYGDARRQYTHSSKKWGGWRLDGFIVSERLLHRIRDCQIRQQVKRQFWPPKDSVGIGALSDHWPVWLSLEMERL
ncbi:Endonuclease/exonuclease/phosphatase [Rhodotorula diobovata]|uniref:Endonuclease/exonuclease/phosphatase n=1 Tax=Rhodotorula diobovata TaxID=5288 RepID=A0A5C5FS42_9BASI|nr:Endonuclease/exonuclease/phosphatase [Rhodotorula diobovata]